jgi:hypothetical protein
MTPYLISKFAEPTLAALIHECFGYDHADIFHKSQINYIFRYLSQFNPNPPKDKESTILLEPKYIDRDFMEDYSNFYVGRFGNDGYQCARLHFFSCSLKHEIVDALLHGKPIVETLDDGRQEAKDATWLQKHYLGFMIIKPLTKTFVGKTCLRRLGDTAEGAGSKRKLSKRYDVDLFGVKLHVESIAFQEQDKVVAACATTAIWTALHSLPSRCVKDVRSCSEITTAALNYVRGSSNGFPNLGLSNKQILRALDVEGIRYHDANLTSRSPAWFKGFVTAYIDSDLSVMLTGDVYRLKVVKNDQGEVTRKKLSFMGQHAITALGYDFRGNSNWVYVHDDRVGPYARAELTTVGELIGAGAERKLRDRCALVMRVRNLDEEWEEVIIPDVSIVPVDKKARLPYAFARATADRIIAEVAAWMEKVAITTEAFRCDIKLSSIHRVRDDVLEHKAPYQVGDTTLEGNHVVDALRMEMWAEEKVRFLTNHLARLQWQLDFHWGNRHVFRVLLDATDIPLGNAISGVYRFDPVYADLILLGFDEQVMKGSATVDIGEQHFYNAFLKSLKRRHDHYEDHLNRHYGALRAPNYIKPDEVSKTGEGTNKTMKRFFDAQDEPLASLFAEVSADPNRWLIWAIGKDGSLFVAEDISDPVVLGHPSMTGMQPARIAGEMILDRSSGEPVWKVNSESGRYSKDYAKRDEYLGYAIRKIQSFFPDTFIKGPARSVADVSAKPAAEAPLEAVG